MNLSKLSVTELAELIRAASLELATRMAEPEIERIQAERPAVALREPPEGEKEFALRVKARALAGQYVTAEERREVARIAEEYGAWVERQGLPTSAGTGPWRKLAERSRIKPARER